MSNAKWQDNAIQFPRLLAEIMATQENIDWQELADSMDLTRDEVDELFDRAQVEWERIKDQPQENPMKHFAVPCVILTQAENVDAAYEQVSNMNHATRRIVIDEVLDAFEYNPDSVEVHSGLDSEENAKHAITFVKPAQEDDAVAVLEAPQYADGRGPFKWATLATGEVMLVVYPQGALFERLMQKGAFQ